MLELFFKGEVRKWLNGESFICGVFRFCYGAGRSMSKMLFFFLIVV